MLIKSKVLKVTKKSECMLCIYIPHMFTIHSIIFIFAGAMAKKPGKTGHVIFLKGPFVVNINMFLDRIFYPLNFP